MWPSKNGLGVGLSYGVSGNGVINLKDNGEDAKIGIDIEFPRKNEQKTIHGIGNSHRTLVRIEESEYSMKSSYTDFKSSVATAEDSRRISADSQWFIPKDILKSYLVESHSLTSTIAFDPSYGELLAFSELRSRNGNFSRKVMAYVSGQVGNIMNISLLRYEHVVIAKSENPTEEYDTYMPEVGTPFQIALSEPIKQIVFSKGLLNYLPSFLLVRTDSKIYVLNCFISSSKVKLGSSNVECDILGDVSPLDLEKFSFADVSFNPYEISKFSIVDIKGNFGIWEIKKDNSKKLVKLSLNQQELTSANSEAECPPSVYDAAELSNWKRIMWSVDTNSIIVGTRSSVTRFTLQPKLSSLKLITSNTWSQIKDIFTHKNYAFLLTSKELIWFCLDSPTQRLVSWKHFLSDDDPSLRLSVTVEESEHKYTCMVYSQVYPLIFVYQYGVINNRPYSLRDPYYIEKHSNTESLHQIKLERFDRSFFSSSRDIIDEADLIIESEDETPRFTTFGLFELTTDHLLSVSLYSELQGLMLQSNDNNRSLSPTDKSDTEIYKPYTSKYFRKFSKQNLTSIIENFMKPHSKLKTSQEIKYIQDYAFKLGEGSSKVKDKEKVLSNNSSYLSLLEISDQVPDHIHDISELDSMIKQLIGFYGEKDIILHSSLSHFVNSSSMIEISTGNEDDLRVLHLKDMISSIYSKIEGTNSQSSILKLAIRLGCSLLRAYTPSIVDAYKTAFEGEFNTANELSKSVLGNWNEDENANDPSAKEPDSQSRFYDIPSSIPTIRLSSQDKPRRHATQDSLRHQALTQNRSQSQMRPMQERQANPSKLSTVNSQATLALEDNKSSQEGSSTSQTVSRTIPSSLRGSQKRPTSLNSSQTKPKKKKRGGFA